MTSANHIDDDCRHSLLNVLKYLFVKKFHTNTCFLNESHICVVLSSDDTSYVSPHVVDLVIACHQFMTSTNCYNQSE